MAQMFQTLCRTMGAQDVLTARCAACGRQARWTRPQALARFGPDATPFDVRRRLKCAACGSGAVQASI
jgi:endogenous inhibitor of DNA gyrase (YacG/DUF329 family)